MSCDCFHRSLGNDGCTRATEIISCWRMETAPTATKNGVRMNKFGAVVFIISMMISAILVLSMNDSGEENFTATQATIGAQTTYDESYSGYYTCTAYIDFTYTAIGDSVSHKGTVEGTMQSSESCLDEIKQAYPIDSTITVYYSDADNSVYRFQQSTNQEISENVMYGCCAGFFGLIGLVSLVFTFTMGAKGVASPTGGLSGRLKNLGASLKNPGQEPAKSSSFQILPSQQGRQMNKPTARKKKWKDGSMPQGRIWNYDSIIDRLNLSQGIKSRGLTSIDEAKAYVKTFGIMNQKEVDNFFKNSYVIDTLGLSHSGSDFNSPPSKGAGKEFWSGKGISTTQAKSADGTCGHSGCSLPVNSFDFRCFDCRKRFCSTHRGKTFQCASCAN